MGWIAHRETPHRTAEVTSTMVRSMKKLSFLLLGGLVLLTGCSSIDTADRTPVVFDPLAHLHTLGHTGFRGDGVAGIIFPANRAVRPTFERTYEDDRDARRTQNSNR